MRQVDQRDVMGGAIMVAIGGFAAINAISTLPIGTLNRMGPGMFPAAVGVITALFGIGIIIPALSREGHLPRFEVLPFVMILAAVGAFALTIRSFGMIPAVIISTVLASLADPRRSVLSTVVLAVVIAGVCWVIFVIGLRVQVSLFNWPW